MGGPVQFPFIVKERPVAKAEFSKCDLLVAPSVSSELHPVFGRILSNSLQNRPGGFLGFRASKTGSLELQSAPDGSFHFGVSDKGAPMLLCWEAHDPDSLRIGAQFWVVWTSGLGYMPSANPPAAFLSDLAAHPDPLAPPADSKPWNAYAFAQWKMLVQGSFTETLALFSADGKTLDAYGLRAAAAGLVFYCAVDEGPTELAQSFSHALVSKYARSWAKGFDSPGSHFGEYLVREISDLHAQLFERLQQDEKALLQPEEGVSN